MTKQMLRLINFALLTSLLVLVFSVSVAADEDGGYAGAFLRLDADARPAAMGGAYTALAQGAMGYHYNAAGPALMTENAISASYRKMGFDRLYGSMAVLFPLHQEAAIVGGWVYGGVSDVFERDPEGQIGGELTEANNSVSFTFAKRFTPWLYVGANLRYVQKNIAGLNANSVGFDLGAMIAPPSLTIGGKNGLSDIRIGLAIERINYKYPWDTQEYWVQYDETGQAFEERWPINVRTGVAAHVYRQHALMAIDVEINEEISPVIHGGLEIKPIRELMIRGGINDQKPTFGLGLLTGMKSSSITLDYAFILTDDNIDDEHLLTMGVRF